MIAIQHVGYSYDHMIRNRSSINQLSGFCVKCLRFRFLNYRTLFQQNFKTMELQDKVAVITGGNSGIGFGIAKAFKNEGALGAIVGRNSETMKEALDTLGSAFTGITGDVTKADDLEVIFQKAFERFGKIDVLVVNAGGMAQGAKMGPVTSTSEDSYDKFMDLNLKSVYFTVQKALPFLKDGASVILIGSVAAHQASSDMSLYAAAKSGVISFARGFSLDLLERKIRVNVISPGIIDTPVINKMVPAEHISSVKELWSSNIPMGRIGQTEDIGNVAVFLASVKSAYMLGTEIIVDGGISSISK